MKLPRFRLILIVTLLSSVSFSLLLDRSIFSASPAIAQTSESRKAEADRLFEQGRQQLSAEEPDAALQSWQQALTIYQEIGDRLGEAASLGSLGNIYNSLGEYEKAIDYFEQSLPIFQQLDNRQGEASSLNNLGLAYQNLGEYEKAIDYFEQSLPIFQQLGSYQEEANSLKYLGNVYLNLKKYNEAIDYYEQSLAIAQRIEERSIEATNLFSLGVAYQELGDYTKALDYYNKCLQTVIEIDKVGSWRLLIVNVIGEFHLNLSQYSDALEAYQQAWAIAKEIDDRLEQGNSLNNIGRVYQFLDRYPEALESYQQALDVFRDLGERKWEGGVLGNLGGLYRLLGQYTQALDSYKQALEIYRSLGARWEENSIFINIGNIYDELGQYSQALEYYQQALEISKDLDDRFQEALVLMNRGITYNNKGQYLQALESLEQSLTIFKQIGRRREEGAALNSLGNAHRFLGQHSQALDIFKQALDIAISIDNRGLEGTILNNIGMTFLQANQFLEAENNLEDAIKVLESLRYELSNEQKVSIFDRQSNTYLLLQQVLIAQNKTDKALEISERGRARALVDLLRPGSSTGSETPPPLEYPSLAQIQQIARQQNATLVEYSIVFNEQLYIYVVQPTGEIEFRAVDLPEDISLAELVDNGRTCIIQDQCRGDGDLTPLNVGDLTVGDLVKFNDDQFEEPWQVVEVDVRQGTLKVKLEGFEGEPIERSITDVAAIVNAFNRPRLQQLHQLLIQPIADLLPEDENERVIFIPHQQLFLVPFPALQDEDGDYLIEKHTLLTAPSIDVLGLTRKQRQNLPDSVRGALVVGNPTMPIVRTRVGEQPEQLSDLPHAETEALEIARLLGTQAFTGNRATKAAILPKLSQARWIHLATHGLLDDFKGLGVPGAIALGPSGTGELNDGLLSAGELLQMDLNAELVVLSACKTGQGDITSDGVIGLSRSLVAAGVPSIVVSLWSVPDAPTAELMMRFYQYLDGTDDKAQALRQAMLDTMAEHPNPRNWAAFTLIGEAF